MATTLNQKKTVLINRATEKDAAKALFGELGIKIVSGHRFLGGFIGEKNEVRGFVLEIVLFWRKFCFGESYNMDIWSKQIG